MHTSSRHYQIPETLNTEGIEARLTDKETLLSSLTHRASSLHKDVEMTAGLGQPRMRNESAYTLSIALHNYRTTFTIHIQYTYVTVCDTLT